MPLIRVMRDSSDHHKWFNNKLNADELMKHIIGNDTSVFSVYKVLTDLEETKAIAAQYLLYRERSSFYTVSSLRIEVRDMSDLQISVEEQRGETGIAEIDLRHRNLIGNKSIFQNLFQRVQDALRLGEDRVRVIAPMQLTCQVQEFHNLNTSAVNEHAKRRCQKLLGIGS